MVFLLWDEQEKQMRLSLTVNLEKDGTVGAVKTERTHRQRGNDGPHWTVRRMGVAGIRQIPESEHVNSVLQCDEL